jgi:hypothetical protein
MVKYLPILKLLKLKIFLKVIMPIITLADSKDIVGILKILSNENK